MAFADDMAALASAVTDPDTGLSGGEVTLTQNNATMTNAAISTTTGLRSASGSPATWTVDAVRSAVRATTAPGAGGVAVNIQAVDYLVRTADLTGLTRRFNERDTVTDGGVVLQVISSDLECDGTLHRITCRADRLGGGS
jgi:hypothetical protein